MGKVIATYLARITLRETEDSAEPVDAPVLKSIEEAVNDAVVAFVAAAHPEASFDVNTTAERVDE